MEPLLRWGFLFFCMAAPRRYPPHPQEVWMKAWCAVATACGCKTPEKATEWADKAMADYLKRWIPKTEIRDEMKATEVTE